MRIVKPLQAALVVAAGLLVLDAGPASACSCRADQAVADQVAASDGAFVGVYTGREDPGAQGPLDNSGRAVLNHFTVERVVKGDLGERVDIQAAASGASCGLELDVGARTGLLLRHEAGGWTSSLCEQVDPKALLTVGPGTAPGGTGGSGGGADWGFIVFAAILVLALPAAFLVGGGPRGRPARPRRRDP